MNAYELADELDGRLDHKAANMLRQQADRIAELEKESANLEQSLKNALVFIDNHKQTKPLSNDEIHKLANEHLRTQNQDEHLVVLGLEDFVRAIEERHGIK